MIIKRFQAKTENDAVEMAKKELGPNVVIMNVKNIKKKGLFGFLKGNMVEVTVALEEERERLQKRVQELEELINGEKEILMKKNVPVEQMLKYLGYEKLTREMLEEYVSGIYVYDDGRVEVEWG